MRAGQRAAALPRALRHLPALLGVALLFGAIYAVQREFRQLRLDDITDAVDAIPLRAIGFALLCTVLAYAVLTLYDRLGTIYAGRKVAYGRVAFASFCAYALSHNLGFAAVSGAAVRYRLYAHWGLTPLQIAKTVAFCSLTFGLGGMVLGGLMLLLEPRAVPFLGPQLPLPAVYAVGALLLAIVGAYLALAAVRPRWFRRAADLPSWRMALLQVALAAADVAITATIFWVLLPSAPGLTWVIFLGVYLVSYSAGLAANVPGGLGVFDSAVLFGLAPFLPADRIIAAILIFRLFYYVIPLFLAGTLFAANEALLRGRTLRRRLTESSGMAAVTRWSEPDLAVAASTGAVALCGVLLLGVGVLSRRTPDLYWADPDLAGIAVHAGQFVPSLIGAGLLVLGVGLAQRVTLAWGLTIALLLLGAGFIAAEGERAWIAAVLVFSALLVAPFRGYFYRHARLRGDPLQPATAASLLTFAVCVLALAGFRRSIHGVPNYAWWEIVLTPRMPWALRASIAVIVVLALAAVWSLIRPCRVMWRPWDTASRERLRRLGSAPAQADGVVWGEAERAAIPFCRIGRVLLGIGDPAGPDSDRVSAIWRLRDLARQEGLDPAIWRAGPALLKVYGDLGLTALPLGSDGLPLAEARHGTPAAGQYLVCVAERDLTALLPLLPRLAAAA